MKTCPNCNELLGNDVNTCFKCKYDFELGRVVTKEEKKQRADEEKKKREEEKQRIEEIIVERKENQNKLEQEISDLSQLPFLSTTGYNFDGYIIYRYIGIVSSEYVLGTGSISEWSASVSDSLGIHSKKMENKIATAKMEAMNTLCKRAVKAGANSIIGVKFNIMTLDANMIVVSVDGTAVMRKEIK